MARLAIATGNDHKVEEILAILTPLVDGLTRRDIVTMRDIDIDEPVENGVTFGDNATIKARHLARATGLPTIADDSGLCVEVMGGAPGIFSARWCGRHGDDQANLDLLLAQLTDVPDEHRGAHFTCSVALVVLTGDGDTVTVVSGDMHGRLLTAPRGEGGFGYDPIFVADGYAVSNAELTPQDKNAISHRAQALQRIAPRIAEVLTVSRC